MSDRWPGQPFLDVLRPAPGWSTEFAVLTSYSVDLVAVVAAMLALAGLDDERGSGSRIDFANALDQLTGKWRVLCQAGRIGVPLGRKSVIGVLDSVVRPMRLDEARESWHPKVALVRYGMEAPGAKQWRLWIGSRNLTRASTLDAGVAFVADDSGVQVPGVAALGRDLAQLSELPATDPAALEEELSRVKWKMPDGVAAVDSVRLFRGQDGRGLPSPPPEVADLIVISPFLDARTVRELAEWGDKNTRRRLVSTLPELTELHAQAPSVVDRFTLLWLDACLPEESDARPSAAQDAHADSEPAAQGSDEAQDDHPRGLHAKLIMASGAGRATLWIGSANATSRGWRGPNTEAVAQLQLRDGAVQGLAALVGNLAIEVTESDLAARPDADPEAEALESARKQVAARWSVTQERTTAGPRLVAAASPHPNDGAVTLEAAILNQSPVEWPRDRLTLQLRPLAGELESELVHLRLRRGDLSCDWLERAQLDPPPGSERDRRAMARYLGPRTFLQWIRTQLQGYDDSDGGGSWDAPQPKAKEPPTYGPGPVWWAPTLEEVLKAWARDPELVRVVDLHVRNYLEYMDSGATVELSAREREALAEFRQTWSVVSAALIGVASQ